MGVDVLGGTIEAAVGTGVLLDSLVGIHALLDVLHHRAHLHVLVTGNTQCKSSACTVCA